MDIANDDVMTIPIVAHDTAGDAVALPVGTTPTVSSSDPGLAVAIVPWADVSQPLASFAYTVTPMVPLLTGASVELDDGTLTPETNVWNIVADVVPRTAASDFAHALHTAQAVPVVGP